MTDFVHTFERKMAEVQSKKEFIIKTSIGNNLLGQGIRV